MNSDYLAQLQSLPLASKVVKSQQRIREWYEHHDGDVYVSFSGGKDSTVMLHVVRQLYPHIPAVFCDTGLEYPEIRDFVKTVENVVWLKPKMPFRKVLDKYGYPVVSKEQSSFIQEYRDTKSDKLRKYRWDGDSRGRFKISEKWKFLVDAPFKISDMCCDVMKKEPFDRYEKETSRAPILGNMASDSNQRKGQYIRHGGCNAFELKRPRSTPIGFWLEQDIWDYLEEFQVPYSRIYDMGYTRTGCMFCLFGLHLDGPETRFDRMERTHPKQWAYCMNVLGLQEIIDYIKSGGVLHEL